ncbi:Hypothetical protein PSEBR_m1598 [Pseudomonas brassicacearum subsp. brassicacearum NFM421]|uniref:Uncharacterized protein n=1 Tax=Pseudomonas brassicacearum (strain NFM421) TaxID=994484 RepID=F2KM26_PSEBN|nr:Hypothetical protein PSEBR_m1598 [Pseudomonas brassicacearum subsp. brassicacearum NFM421]
MGKSVFILLLLENETTVPKTSGVLPSIRNVAIVSKPFGIGHIACSAQLSYCAGTYERDFPCVDCQQTSGSNDQGSRPLALARLNILRRPCRTCTDLPSLPACRAASQGHHLPRQAQQRAGHSLKAVFKVSEFNRLLTPCC